MKQVLAVRGLELELEHVACDLCGGAAFSQYWKKMRHGLDLPTVFCDDCGLCMTNPRPTAAALATFYAKAYLDFHTDERDFDLARPRKLGEQRFSLLSRFIEPSRDVSLFEIGVGMGQFQVAARERSQWRLRGIEPGDRQYAYVQGTLGLAVEQRFLDDVVDVAEFDCVASFHVLEHSASPLAFLRKARSLLLPGAKLYLEVPNLERPETSLNDFFQLPHLYNFTALTLRNLLVKAGFRPMFWMDKTGNLSVISIAADIPEADDFALERFELDQLKSKLLMHERLVHLSRFIPNVPLLRKVSATMVSI